MKDIVEDETSSNCDLASENQNRSEKIWKCYLIIAAVRDETAGKNVFLTDKNRWRRDACIINGSSEFCENDDISWNFWEDKLMPSHLMLSDKLMMISLELCGNMSCPADLRRTKEHRLGWITSLCCHILFFFKFVVSFYFLSTGEGYLPTPSHHLSEEGHRLWFHMAKPVCLSKNFR